jgi:hypothetical protein
MILVRDGTRRTPPATTAVQNMCGNPGRALSPRVYDHLQQRVNPLRRGPPPVDSDRQCITHTFRIARPRLHPRPSTEGPQHHPACDTLCRGRTPGKMSRGGRCTTDRVWDNTHTPHTHHTQQGSSATSRVSSLSNLPHVRLLRELFAAHSASSWLPSFPHSTGPNPQSHI